MNDCPNADIRDRLPDLVHERLDASMRSRVTAHVERCADCQAELALLRGMRDLLATTPRIDLAAIVGALPNPATVGAARVRARRQWSGIDWRVAAAILVMAVGSASVGTYLHVGTPGPAVEAVAGMAGSAHRALDTAVPAASHATAGAASHAPAAAPVTELATGDGLSDMNEQQLQALLQDIEQFHALPSADPDSIVVTAPDVGNTGGY